MNKILLETLFSDDSGSFVDGLRDYFLALNINDFTLWSITGNICEVIFSTSDVSFGTVDIFELGFDNSVLQKVNKEVRFFNELFTITYSIFLGHRKRLIYAVTLHDTPTESSITELEEYAPFIGKAAANLVAAEKRMDVYVDYQKKVDFVKRSVAIFKALNIEEVISLSINFFMEAFSGEAACVVHKQKVSGIGVAEHDIIEDITINGTPLKEYMEQHRKTEFLENIAISTKFNIRNIFLVYEEVSELHIALFNITTDIVPDKDFSSLVSAIVSIAVENAESHEKIMKFKLEENEISTTVEILNKFVQRSQTVDSIFDINAIAYPARNAGGDFIYLEKVGNSIAFCVADVCGKGYSAAVFTVVLSVFMTSFGNLRSMESSLEKLNKFLIDKNFDNRFITLFAGVVEENTRELEYISCGHDPAVIISQDGEQILKSSYMPLGLIEETFKTSRTVIPPNSTMCIYTDGLIEYTNFDNLIAFIRSLATLPAKDITSKLYEQLVTDRSLQRDDFTCIVLKDKNN